jgi:hypothetical protein
MTFVIAAAGVLDISSPLQRWNLIHIVARKATD